MIPIFDLDDTLYDERTFVLGGLRAVAQWGDQVFGWPQEPSLAFMVDILDSDGRGAIFDRWLAKHGAVTRQRIDRCIQTYRYHEPLISLEPPVRKLLQALCADHHLYLVTDGNKIVQARKIDVLGLHPYFQHVYITNRYGSNRAKPSIYCFDLIRKRERCCWRNLVYIGDNPAKDFVNLNARGSHTIRVLTGAHRRQMVPPEYDGQHTIRNLTQLPRVLAILDSS